MYVWEHLIGSSINVEETNEIIGKIRPALEEVEKGARGQI